MQMLKQIAVIFSQSTTSTTLILAIVCYTVSWAWC